LRIQSQLGWIGSLGYDRHEGTERHIVQILTEGGEIRSRDCVLHGRHAALNLSARLFVEEEESLLSDWSADIAAKDVQPKLRPLLACWIRK
jgi:hypothetical protein